MVEKRLSSIELLKKFKYYEDFNISISKMCVSFYYRISIIRRIQINISKLNDILHKVNSGKSLKQKKTAWRNSKANELLDILVPCFRNNISLTKINFVCFQGSSPSRVCLWRSLRDGITNVDALISTHECPCFNMAFLDEKSRKDQITILKKLFNNPSNDFIESYASEDPMTKIKKVEMIKEFFDYMLKDIKTINRKLMKNQNDII